MESSTAHIHFVHETVSHERMVMVWAKMVQAMVWAKMVQAMVRMGSAGKNMIRVFENPLIQ